MLALLHSIRAKIMAKIDHKAKQTTTKKIGLQNDAGHLVLTVFP